MSVNRDNMMRSHACVCVSCLCCCCCCWNFLIRLVISFYSHQQVMNIRSACTCVLCMCMPDYSPSSASHGIRSLHRLAFSLAPFHSSFYVSVGIRSVRRHSLHISCSCMTIHIRIVCMCAYRCLMRSANSRRIYVCG